MKEEKLQKVLQTAGIDSRRNIRQYIHDERIKVNNQVITDPNSLVDIEKDTLRLDNKKLKLTKEKKSYYIFHKPYGVISTLHDPQGRPAIKDFITGIKERVYPVGRLDYHSEGLILLTNDGELTNFVISPKNKIPKVYLVKIKGILIDKERQQLKTKGIFLEGRRVKPLQIDFVKKTARGNSWIRVTIIEGKKHIIRNLLKYTGHPVEKLKRTAIGTIKLKKLPAGHWHELTNEELETFKKTYNYTE
ncbi:MAG: rRNA pseudouridine synthase [Candidatus Aminicenantes bacterium]|nr:MAG: rRNA pseudouridine synthase [Candidatus Aminicenantes bacterium]